MRWLLFSRIWYVCRLCTVVDVVFATTVELYYDGVHMLLVTAFGVGALRDDCPGTVGCQGPQEPCPKPPDRLQLCDEYVGSAPIAVLHSHQPLPATVKLIWRGRRQSSAVFWLVLLMFCDVGGIVFLRPQACTKLTKLQSPLRLFPRRTRNRRSRPRPTRPAVVEHCPRKRRPTRCVTWKCDARRRHVRPELASWHPGQVMRGVCMC